MLVKKVSYVDFKGNTREEELYFNLTKAEVAEMELSHKGGLSTKIERIVAAQDTEEIIKLFKDLILTAYGVISDDGRRFIKTPELREEFAQTQAYSDLFMELAADADAAAKFVNAITPKLDNTKPVIK